MLTSEERTRKNSDLEAKKLRTKVNKRVGDALRFLMRKRKITARALGEATKMHHVTISRALNGRNQLSPVNIRKLADELCKKVSERLLLERACEMKHSHHDFPYYELPNTEEEHERFIAAEISIAEKAKKARIRSKVRKILHETGMENVEDFVEYYGDSVEDDEDSVEDRVTVDFLVTLHFEEYEPEAGIDVPVEHQIGIVIADGQDTKDNSAASLYLRYCALVDTVLIIESDGATTVEQASLSGGVPITPDALGTYLAKLKAKSCPAPKDEKDVAFEEQVKARLQGLKIHTSTKDCTNLIVRGDKKTIAFFCPRELKRPIFVETREALDVRNKLKCVNAILIIPDKLGIKYLEVENGIKVLALSQLSTTTIGLNG